jgi:formylglycine-generating enzyme required for sulfatase activity
MISFRCPVCRATLKSKQAQPGDQLQCRECEQLVTVPDAYTEKSSSPKWIIIGTAILGLLAALFIAIARYYEIHKARAEAARAEAEAERAKRELRPETTKKRSKDNSGANGNQEPVKKIRPAKDNNRSELKGAFTYSLGMEFVLVPKGRSWLGGGGGNPGPREVEIPHAFYLGKYEVTQGEWQKVMGNNPSITKAAPGVSKEDLERFPVENVTWYDTQEYIKKLNSMVDEPGWVYRLPKADEWEYACRGGPLADKVESRFDFYFDKPTNELLPQQANFNNVPGRTCKVGSYKPNRLGLYDMHGNVWEWCDDSDNSVDPSSIRRIRRGGGWGMDAHSSWASYRFAAPRTDKGHSLGFRLARVPVRQ